MQNKDLLVGWVLALLVVLLSATFAHADAPTLKPGDRLLITIPAEVVTQKEVTIDERGEVDLELYGRVRVAGLSLEKATKALRTELARFLRNPDGVELLLTESRRLVRVTGRVKKPGFVTLSDDMDAWLAIAAAEGLAKGADLSRVMLQRDAGDTEFDLRAYLSLEGPRPPELEAGDTIFVPAIPGWTAESGVAPMLTEQAAHVRVFVVGAVRNPGSYPRSDGLDVLGALALAAGPTADANLVEVRLVTAEGATSLNVASALASPCYSASSPTKPSPDTSSPTVCSPGDNPAGASESQMVLPSKGPAIIYVPHKPSDSAAEDPFGVYVYVYGAVAKPGRISTDGPVSLHEIIALAGGARTDGDLSDVRLVRRMSRYTIATRHDISELLTEGGISQPFVRPGDTVHVAAETPGIARTGLRVLSDAAILATALVLLLTL